MRTWARCSSKKEEEGGDMGLRLSPAREARQKKHWLAIKLTKAPNFIREKEGGVASFRMIKAS